MNTIVRSLSVIAISSTLAFGLFACNKNKTVETDPVPAVEPEPAPAASTAKTTLNGEAEVSDNAFHPTRIAEAVTPILPELTACFAGKDAMSLKINITVNKQGEATSVKPNMGSPELEQCLSTTLRKISYPEPRGDGPAKVVLPLSYTP